MKTVTKNLILTIILLATAYSTLAASIRLDEDFTVNFAETESISLRKRQFVKNLIIQAEGVRRASTVEVMVNGEVKGTLYAPGSDPSYVVTIAEETSSIEFRHRDGASMKIRDILVHTVNTNPVPRTFNTQTSDGVDQLARTVIRLVDVLTPFSTLDQEEKYLLPLKKSAAKVFIMDTARGSLSIKTRMALVRMAKLVEFADPYLDELMEQSGLFEYAVEILIVKETVRELLN